MKYVYKQLVTEWYCVEADSREEAEDAIYEGNQTIVNYDHHDLVFVKTEETV